MTRTLTTILALCCCTVSFAQKSDSTEINKNIVKFRVDESGLIEWIIVNEQPKATYEIQDFRWNKWVKIAEITGKGKGDQSYSFDADTSCGLYQLRIKAIGTQKPFSNSIAGPNPKKVKLIRKPEHPLFKKEVKFDTRTRYQLYDVMGILLEEDCDEQLDIKSLDNGTYYINYGNSTGKFVIE